MIKTLTPEEVHARKVAHLGLDYTALDLSSVEAIAAALRRVSRFLCPCSPATLVHAITEPLRGLVEDIDELRISVRDTLDSMIGHGDFLEYRDVSGESTTTLIYAAPGSFVVRKSGKVILLGIATSANSVLSDEIEKRIDHVNHLRSVTTALGEDLGSELRQSGFVEIPYDQWVRMPQTRTAEHHLALLDGYLNLAHSSGDVPGLTLLDSDRNVRYYRGRWVEPNAQSGKFVGRRRQAYGADLWCYVEMNNGQPTRLVDFPLTGSQHRGCDEAWHLQMAIDSQRNEPQQFRVQTDLMGRPYIQFFSPVPRWAQRRWDGVGEPVSSDRCLFAYRFDESELDEEIQFIHEYLWLSERA